MLTFRFAGGLILILLSIAFDCESKTLTLVREEVAEQNHNIIKSPSNEIVFDRREVFSNHFIIERHMQHLISSQMPAESQRPKKEKDIKQSEVSIKQDNVKDRLHHIIIKRHAAPDPRPRPRPHDEGASEKVEHQGFIVRSHVKVGTAGLIITAVAMSGLLFVITFLIIFYWRRLICK